MVCKWSRCYRIFEFSFICFVLIDKIYGNSNFLPDYPNITYCIVPETHPSFPDFGSNYFYLTNKLVLTRRCTHIRGSLYLEKLSQLANGKDPDLSFLDSIIEISGILRIRQNSVRRIPLVNLKIIRGIMTSLTKESLQISHNRNLEDLDLRSLRVIMNLNVRINNNQGLDYFVQKVDWSQILADNRTQTTTIAGNIDREENVTCHRSCDYWEDKSGNLSQFCFGPSEKQCQSRTKCAPSTNHVWCQFNEGVGRRCDRECVGGCHGDFPTQCVACKRVFKKDQCVSHCSYQHEALQFGSNVHDRLTYTTGSVCTSQCPGSLMDQEKVCVYQCDFDKYYKDGTHCIQCPNSRCNVPIGDKLQCSLEKLNSHFSNRRKKELRKETLKQLTNCTILVGNLIINDESFRSGITVQMLYDHLKNIREIMGGFNIHLKNTEIKNLTFFKNLREIRGTIFTSKIQTGLWIFVDSIEFLGLKRLEKVYGVVNFNHPSKLCYDSSIPWMEITSDTYSATTCKKQCDPLCTRGCWGPGNMFCYKCQFIEAGDFCVKNCSDVPGYYSDRSLGCRPCNPLCHDNCTGPSARQCLKCRFFKENGNCVESCSSNYYPVVSAAQEDIECKPCHATCLPADMLKTFNISEACSGPLNHVGEGGCAMCHKVIRSDNTTRCHIGKCPVEYFENKVNETMNTWSIQHVSCDPCHPLCGKCSDFGTHRSSCQQCKGFWFKDFCRPNCPKVVDNESRAIKQSGQCAECHRECKYRCLTENNSSACDSCMNKKLFTTIDQKEFTCVSHCPATRNYTDYSDGNFVCLAYEETMQYQQRKRIMTVTIGSLACLVAIVTVIVLVFKWKSRHSQIKAELKAFYSNFNEPNGKNMKDQIHRPPNKNRLQMISIKDLIFDIKSKPLGAGAFGKVYRGYWRVKGPDSNFYRLDVVVKIINNTSKSSTNEFLEEAQIMASVSHRYCLPLIGVCLSLQKPCLVSTFAEYGSLEKYLHQYSTKLSSFILLKWSEQIADGMAYLNMRGIIHRDLATRNILVTSKNIVQITDFGLAKLVDDTDDGIVVQSGRVPIRWLALETLLSSSYSSASDVWAYGITLWEIFTFGKRPYTDIDTSKVKTYLLEGNRLPQPEICTLDVYMTMIKCWLDDPHMRLTFTELTSIFEHYSYNSKRYLCISREHDCDYMSNQYDNPEEICLNPISAESPSKAPMAYSNGGDDIPCAHVSYNDSCVNMNNPSYDREDDNDHNILPMRLKRKRNVSFDRLKKLGFPKVLSPKSNESNNLQYSPTNSYDGRKSPSVRYDSTSVLVANQITFECDGSPLNPQIAKLLKQESMQSPRLNHSAHRLDRLPQSDKMLNDNKLREEAAISCLKLIERNAGTRSPSLSSFDGARHPLLAEHPSDVDIKQSLNSPDSGNSHEFEIDDFLVPSRIHSLGYYNLTPSPTDAIKPTMDLSDANITAHNPGYQQIFDDGYLEPTPTLNR